GYTTSPSPDRRAARTTANHARDSSKIIYGTVLSFDIGKYGSRLWIALYLMRNEDGTTKATQKALGEICGLQTEAVKKYLGLLAKHGFLITERKGNPPTYRVVVNGRSFR
ncbi:hypothetical protein, partial [Streptomyces acidiscabies]